MPGGLADLCSCDGFVVVHIPLYRQHSVVKFKNSLFGADLSHVYLLKQEVTKILK